MILIIIHSVNEDPARGPAESLFMFDFSDTKKFGTLTSNDLTQYLKTDAGKTLINSVNKIIPGYLNIFNNYFGSNFEHQTKDIGEYLEKQISSPDSRSAPLLHMMRLQTLV
jgi:hypothetical protein